MGWRQSEGRDLALYVMFTFFAFVVVFVYVVKWLRLFKPIVGAEKINPETADLPSLLEWLDLHPLQ